MMHAFLGFRSDLIERLEDCGVLDPSPVLAGLVRVVYEHEVATKIHESRDSEDSQ